MLLLPKPSGPYDRSQFSTTKVRVLSPLDRDGPASLPMRCYRVPSSGAFGPHRSLSHDDEINHENVI